MALKLPAEARAALRTRRTPARRSLSSSSRGIAERIGVGSRPRQRPGESPQPGWRGSAPADSRWSTSPAPRHRSRRAGADVLDIGTARHCEIDPGRERDETGGHRRALVAQRDEGGKGCRRRRCRPSRRASRAGCRAPAAPCRSQPHPRRRPETHVRAPACSRRSAHSRAPPAPAATSGGDATPASRAHSRRRENKAPSRRRLPPRRTRRKAAGSPPPRQEEWSRLRCPSAPASGDRLSPFPVTLSSLLMRTEQSNWPYPLWKGAIFATGASREG